MRKLMFLVALMCSFHVDAEERVCYLQERVKISEIDAPIVIEGEGERLRAVAIDTAVNCRTGRVIVPGSFEDAVLAVDKALPLDLKVGLISGAYVNPYVSTSYGASVLEDIDIHLQRRWGKGVLMKLCAAKGEDFVRLQGGCFNVLIDELRRVYKDAAK